MYKIQYFNSFFPLMQSYNSVKKTKQKVISGSPELESIKVTAGYMGRIAIFHRFSWTTGSGCAV